MEQRLKSPHDYFLFFSAMGLTPMLLSWNVYMSETISWSDNNTNVMELQALRRQCFAGVRGEWTKGCSLWQLSEEESILLCACHLLNCDEGQGQWSITGFWHKVNGVRQTKKEKSEPSRVYINPGHQFRSWTCLLAITLWTPLGKVAMR
jgi:hypothetical protein